MDKEVKEIFSNIEKKFKYLFGRKPSKSDYIIFDALDNDMEKFIRDLKYNSDISKAYVYAYDRTGLLLSSFNEDKLSDIEIEEFNEAMQEYNDLLNAPLKANQGNVLQVAEATNSYIKNLWEQNSENLIYVLNRYIKDTTKDIGIKNGFSVKSRTDFFVYCIYKTIQNIGTLQNLIKEGYTENSLAVVRFIYEILLNVIVYLNNEDLFKNKIIPLAGLDLGTFERKNNSNTLIEKSTGKEFYCSIKVSKLAEYAGTNYELLYNTLYNDLSGFIHVDTLTAKKIFSRPDNFLDIDECYVAGILALIFAIEMISELSMFENTPLQLQKDLKYYINNTKKNILNSLDIIQVLDNKEIYSIIKKTFINNN